MKFQINDLLQLQSLAFPLIKMVGGPDIPRDVLEPTAGHLTSAGQTLKEASDVLLAAGAALEDGHLSLDEINGILAEANEAKDAFVKLTGGDEPEGD